MEGYCFPWWRLRICNGDWMDIRSSCQWLLHHPAERKTPQRSEAEAGFPRLSPAHCRILRTRLDEAAKELEILTGRHWLTVDADTTILVYGL